MVEDRKVKVPQLDCTSVCQEDVLQLDVPVCHAHSMDGCQRVQQGRSNLRGGGKSECRGVRLSGMWAVMCVTWSVGGFVGSAGSDVRDTPMKGPQASVAIA
jgi:hypothetical protein